MWRTPRASSKTVPAAKYFRETKRGYRSSPVHRSRWQHWFIRNWGGVEEKWLFHIYRVFPSNGSTAVGKVSFITLSSSSWISFSKTLSSSHSASAASSSKRVSSQLSWCGSDKGPLHKFRFSLLPFRWACPAVAFFFFIRFLSLDYRAIRLYTRHPYRLIFYILFHFYSRYIVPIYTGDFLFTLCRVFAANERFFLIKKNI